MLYITSGIALFINFIRKKSKICLALLFVVMFILMAYSSGNADYSVYEMYFRLYGSNLSWSVLLLNNGLFQILCAVFTLLGLTYEHMLIFMALVGFINLYYTHRRLGATSNIAFCLYFIFPFIMDITQIRNFVSMSFMLLGCTYLLKEKNTIKAATLFSVFNLIATFFHFTFIFYFALVVIRFINKKNWKYIAPLTVVLEIFMMNVVISKVAQLTSVERTEIYFGQHISLMTLIVIVVLFVSIISIVWTVSKKNPNVLWLNNLYRLNIFLVILIPIIYYSFEFLRLYRNIFFLNYVAVSYCAQSGKHQLQYRNKRSFILNGAKLRLFIMFIIACFSFYLFIYHDYANSVVIPAFELNRIWSAV